MTELQRWKDIVAGKVGDGSLKRGQIPGYTPPSPMAVIYIPDSRVEGPSATGFSPIKSFQATLQSRVAALANNNFFRTNADSSLVQDLLGQSADDAVAYLGDADPDCTNRDSLLKDYIQLYWVSVTPV